MPTVGKYELLEEIGAGGMGKVFKARHTSLDRLAAIKIIRSEYAKREDVLARFKREASVCANLHHRNVIELYDYGEEDGVLYYAMEYLDRAVDLGEYIETNGSMKLPSLTRAAEQLCSAFTHLHDNGVVHRDVKPANIMISRDGHLTLMDFGLVHKVEGTALTKEGKAIGTPRYMAPEQLMGEKADERTDIFQLGLVLYELATSQKAFQGKDVYAIAHAVLKKAPPAPSSHKAELPQEFDNVILKCLHKKREDRFQSAQELWSALQALEKKPAKKISKGIKETAILSKFSNSTISSDDLQLAPSSRGLLAVGFLLALLFIFLIRGFFFGTKTQFSSRNFKVRAHMSAAVVTWQSAVAYESKVVVLPLDRNAVPIGAEMLSRAKDGKTKEHKVLIKPLVGGKKYSFSVLYPNGKRSLPRYATVLKDSELVLARWSTSYPSLTSHKILWESNVPCRCEVSYLRRGKNVDVVVSPTPRKKHELLLTGIGEEEVLQQLRVKLIGLSRQQIIPWGDVQGVSKFARQITQELEDFQESGLLEQVSKAIRSLPTRGRQAVMDDVQHKLLAQNTMWQRISNNRKLLGEIFRSSKMSPTKVKMPLYLGLRKVEMVDALLNWQRLEGLTKIDQIYRPFIDLQRSKQRPYPVKELLFSLEQLDCSFLPINIDDTFLSITGNHRTGKDRKEIAEVELTDFLQQAPKRLVLAARVRNVSPEYFLQVKINDQGVVHLYNDRKSGPPTRWLTGYKPEMGETEAYLSSLNYLYARIPKEFLRRGKNRFAASFCSIPTVNSVHVIQIRELYLSY